MKTIILATAMLITTGAAWAQEVNFGDDGSEYAENGICDDGRFVGFGMAYDLDGKDILADATDCRFLYEKGGITLINEVTATASTQCDSIDFGDDTSKYANDSECDDPRFGGIGSADSLRMQNAWKDASDCRTQCLRGRIYLRQ